MGAFGLPYRIDYLTGGDSGPAIELEYDAFAQRTLKRQLAADDALESEQLYIGDEFEVSGGALPSPSYSCGSTQTRSRRFWL